MSFLRRLLGGSPQSSTGSSTTERDVTVHTFENVRGEASVEVVGEQYHHEAMTAFRQFIGAGAGKAMLMREPTNPRDANAIGVYGWTAEVPKPLVALVGYLGREEAVAYRPVFDHLGDKVVACDAAIAPYRGGGGVDGVVLHLGTPGELIAELWVDDHPGDADHAYRDKTVSFTGFGLSLAGVTLDAQGQALLARLSGCVVARSVTKKVDICVAYDPRQPTTNSAKARDYGIPVVSERDFWIELGVDPALLADGLGRWAQPAARAWSR